MNENEIRRIVESTVDNVKNGKREMSLYKADKLADAVLKEALKTGVKAVVCVADAGGHPKTVKVMDDAYIASYDIAVNKAFTSVSLKMSTSELKKLAQPGAELYGIQFTNGGKIVIFGGGEVLTCDGAVIGGLGVSGGTEKQDTYLGEFGKRYFEEHILK